MDGVVVTVDIACAVMDEDKTGGVGTFPREARDPALIEPGAIVVVGDAEVVDVLEKPAGPIVNRPLERSERAYRNAVTRTLVVETMGLEPTTPCLQS